MTGDSLWRIRLTVPAAYVEAYADLLADQADAVAQFEVVEDVTWAVEATCQQKPDQATVESQVALMAMALGIEAPVVEIDAVPQVDWLAQSYASFKPITAGRYFIHGSHYTEAPPAGTIALKIDAATAFGSGEHGTTWGCLTALDRLAAGLGDHPAVLDMGCGSGILALAAAKTWQIPVTAVDIDEESVRVTLLNADENGAALWMRAACGDGYACPLVAETGPFDLIFANILARPLADMAPQLAHWLKPGGTAILSGLLDRQEDMVVAAHTAQGLRFVDHIPAGEWRTLIMQK